MQDFPQSQLLFEQYILKNSFEQEPVALYEPVNYIMQLGGKRLRPALLLMSCRLFDAEASQALPAAYAVEIFHNFSLVHDDIMDAAPLRRGKPTVHQKFGTNAGILSGDVMLIYAYEYLLKVDKPHLIKDLVHIFNRFAIEVCEGQQMDMNFEKQTNVTIADYLKMIELKTAALIGGALELGALIGGASAQEAAHLAAFGRNAGIAFQLQDDMLDTFGDPAKVGKKPGGDIIQNKKTYLIIKALELADERTKAELMQWMTTTPTDENEKIQRVTSILQQLNIPTIVENIKADFMNKAYAHLEQVNGNQAIKNELKTLADMLANRDF
ncbi:MAG: polyprenyl synthetase family protein [Saprospiraceae bacterium]